jgi:hypothetical protein
MFIARPSKFAAVAVMSVAMAGGSTAFAVASSAPTPAGGTIHVYISTAGRSTTVAPILVTGAIGDFGRATTVDRTGKVDANGAYRRVTLSKGTFTIDARVFDANLAKLRPSFNATTCSEFFTGSGPATLSKGTGLYKGVTGTARLTETIATLLPRLSNGACDHRAGAQPISEYSFVTGAGPVRF